jgi:hypothetical protein
MFQTLARLVLYSLCLFFVACQRPSAPFQAIHHQKVRPIFAEPDSAVGEQWSTSSRLLVAPDQPSIEPQLWASSAPALAVSSPIIQIKKTKQILSKNSNKFFKKIFLKKTVRQLTAKKLKPISAGWDEWDNHLRIGALLIGVAVLLGLIGVSGFISGLVALGGAILVVIGIVHTY